MTLKNHIFTTEIMFLDIFLELFFYKFFFIKFSKTQFKTIFR